MTTANFDPFSGCELRKFMGKQQIHMFFGGFAAKDITTLAQLKALPLEEIIKICGGMKMPRGAIDRLLESTGIRKPASAATAAAASSTPKPATKAVVTPPAAATKPSSAKQSDPVGSFLKSYTEKTAEPAASTEGKSADPEDKAEKSKREASSYYHFASTPAEEAAKFKPKQVENSDSVQWQKAEGASAWNPGNTFEERNYTKIANERFEEMMKSFKWPGTKLRVSALPKINMDFSIICVRGKVKYIYDMSFDLEVKGKVGDDSVKGTIEMSDIMPDDDPDEWEWSVNMKKNDAAHKSAAQTLESKKELVVGNVKLLIAQLKARYGPS